MTQFKIGDRVRVKSDRGYWAGVEGVVCSVDEKYVYFHQNEGAKFQDGSTVYDAEGGHGFYHYSMKLLPAVVSPTPDERAVAPELVARLVELARSVATSPACTILQTVEAQNILAILDTAAGDEIVAKESCKENGWGESSGAKDLALKSITRGRQLEKEGK